MRPHIQQKYKDYFDYDITPIMTEINNAKQYTEMMTIFSNGRDTQVLVANMFKQLGEKELCRAATLSVTMQHLTTSQLYHMCRKANLSVHAKMQKKGAYGYIKTIMSRYHKPQVYAAMNADLDYIIKKQTPFMFDITLSLEEIVMKYLLMCSNNDILTLDEHAMSRVKVLMYYYAASFELHSLSDFMLDTFNVQDWLVLEGDVFHLYFLLQGFAFDSKEYNRYTTTLRNEAKLQNKLKQQEQEILSYHKKQQTLREQLAHTQIDLKGQLDLAFEEIDRLTIQINEQDEEMKMYQNQVKELKWHLEQKGKEATKYTPLEGYIICVVGDPKKKFEYKALVEKYGGTYRFFPSIIEESLHLLDGQIRNADIVMYLSCYTTHSVSDKMKSLISTDKIFNLNSTGIHTFAYELLSNVVPLLKVQNSKHV